MKRLNKKGFTLIELLAVIIILGILMIIAIPSVTSYIQSTRKNAYVSSASGYVDTIMKDANLGQDLKLYNSNVLYMVAVGDDPELSCVTLESGGQSPYSDTWKYAFVGITVTNNGYNYYFISEDGSGQGLPFVSKKDLDDKGIDKLYSARADSTTTDDLATDLETAYKATAHTTEDSTALAAQSTHYGPIKTEIPGLTSIEFINKKADHCKYPA